MKQFLFLLTIVVLITGCATAHKIISVEIGMTREEVIKAMGSPNSISAKGNTEYLNYALSETDDDAFVGRTTPYYIRLINGRVDSYGRSGDFDSTQKPTIQIETNEKIKTESDVNVTGKKDLYLELKKLKELLDSGIITQEEFEIEKKELLEKY